MSEFQRSSDDDLELGLETLLHQPKTFTRHKTAWLEAGGWNNANSCGWNSTKSCDRGAVFPAHQSSTPAHFSTEEGRGSSHLIPPFDTTRPFLGPFPSF